MKDFYRALVAFIFILVICFIINPEKSEPKPEIIDCAMWHNSKVISARLDFEESNSWNVDLMGFKIAPVITKFEVRVCKFCGKANRVILNTEKE